jgi:hypothetical protein
MGGRSAGVFRRSAGGDVVKLLCSDNERSDVSLLTGLGGFFTLS